VAFGMRKALQAEQGKSDMENRIVQLEGEKKVCACVEFSSLQLS